MAGAYVYFFFSSRRRHTRFDCDWSSDVCSSDLSLIPGDAERVARLDGVLVGGGDDGHEPRGDHRRDVALHLLRGAVVDRRVLAGLAGGWIGDLGVHHSGKERVDPEPGPPVRFLRDVEAGDPLADDPVLARLLEPDLLEVILRQRLG